MIRESGLTIIELELELEHIFHRGDSLYLAVTYSIRPIVGRALRGIFTSTSAETKIPLCRAKQ